MHNDFKKFKVAFLYLFRNLLQDEGGHLKIGEYWVQMLYELHPNQESIFHTFLFIYL